MNRCRWMVIEKLCCNWKYPCFRECTLFALELCTVFANAKTKISKVLYLKCRLNGERNNFLENKIKSWSGNCSFSSNKLIWAYSTMRISIILYLDAWIREPDLLCIVVTRPESSLCSFCSQTKSHYSFKKTSNVCGRAV